MDEDEEDTMDQDSGMKKAGWDTRRMQQSNKYVMEKLDGKKGGLGSKC